jgi:glycopeptide antibiotics resistance protein
MNDILFIQFIPYPLLVYLTILALICILNRKRGARYLIYVIVFGLYILEVINLLFFPFYIMDNWPANITRNEILRTLNDVNLKPLYFLSFSDRPFSMQWVLVDFGLNLLLTIPFGVGIGYFNKPRFLKLCLWAFGAGLSLEAFQLLIKLAFNNYHVVDINDVILNTLGVFVGYFLYITTKWFFTRKPKTRNEIPSQ